jgi:hypothetical protein
MMRPEPLMNKDDDDRRMLIKDQYERGYFVS